MSDRITLKINIVKQIVTADDLYVIFNSLFEDYEKQKAKYEEKKEILSEPEHSSTLQYGFALLAWLEVARRVQYAVSGHLLIFFERVPQLTLQCPRLVRNEEEGVDDLFCGV